MDEMDIFAEKTPSTIDIVILILSPRGDGRELFCIHDSWGGNYKRKKVRSQNLPFFVLSFLGRFLSFFSSKTCFLTFFIWSKRVFFSFFLAESVVSHFFLLKFYFFFLGRKRVFLLFLLKSFLYKFPLLTV